MILFTDLKRNPKPKKQKSVRDRIIDGTFVRSGCITVRREGEDFILIKCFDKKTKELVYKRMVRPLADPTPKAQLKSMNEMKEVEQNRRELQGENIL